MRDVDKAVSAIKKFYERMQTAVQNGNVAQHLKAEVVETTDAMSENLLNIRDTAERASTATLHSEDLGGNLEGAAKALEEKFSHVNAEFATIAPRIADRYERKQLWQLLEGVPQQFNTARILEEAKDARDETLRARDAAKQAAGEVGSSHQAEHYEKFASSERRSANWLRLAAVVVLVLIALAALLLALRTSYQEKMVGELAKLAVAVPLAALAAYLGRESGRHRCNANWAQELAMQLRTFDAFTAPMGETYRDQQRSDFGKLLFGKVERSVVETERGPSVLTELAKLVEITGKLGVDGTKRTNRDKFSSNAFKPARAAGRTTNNGA